MSSARSHRSSVTIAALLIGAALVTWIVTYQRVHGMDAGPGMHAPSPAEMNQMQQSKPPMTTAPTMTESLTP